MIGVTIGVGDYRPLAERAAASMAQHTGLRCVVLGGEHYRRSGLVGENASLLKLWLWDFVDEEEVLLFDADTVCFRPWSPAQFHDGVAVVAVRDWIWRAGIQAEAASVAVPVEEYFLGCLLLLNRSSHRQMLHLARDIYPQTSKLVLEQTALNAARHRLGLPLRLLDRRYSWSLFGRGNLHREAAVITGHYNDRELRSDFAAVCETASGGEIDESAFGRLGNRYYRYVRVGHDERPLQLRGDGTIGQGGGDAERFWFVRQSDGQRILVIGSETMVTCELHLDGDGVWRGRWLEYERMPIELHPHRSQVLLDLVGDRQQPLCGAEIGVFEGHTSAVLLRELPNLQLWMVDRWQAPRPGDRYWQDPYMRQVPQQQMDLARQSAHRATEFARDRRTVLIAEQAAAAESVADASLDFVFLDADHSLEGTREAIDTWWPKVRPDGIVAGHDLDYPGFPGVRQAVEEQAQRRGLSWERAPDFVWYFRKRPAEAQEAGHPSAGSIERGPWTDAASVKKKTGGVRVTDCECTEPGWCERHRCHKTRMWFQLCRRSPQLFALWEQGRGPGQPGVQRDPDARKQACMHRGEVLRIVDCPTCRGRVGVKVFACQLHEQCTIAMQVANITCCGTCAEYQPCGATRG